MLSNHCDHGHDDENLLLDDDNTTRCEKCASHNTSRIISDNFHTNGAFNNAILTISLDETLEDSPLLINDCYMARSDDFHCHDLYTQPTDQQAWEKLVAAAFLCFLFMLTEIVGGYIAGSLAVMTDAAHLFSDLIGFLISLLSIWIARKPPTRRMTFGYHRAEVLGAFLSVVSIWLLALIFVVLAVGRLYRREYEIDANAMIVVAALGLFVNLTMGAVLFGFCHTHSHGLPGAHSHSNINVRAAAAHILGDLLQSFGVLVAAIIIKIFPNAEMADPICTLLFSLFILGTTAKVAKDSIWLLLEGSPKSVNELKFELEALSSIRHVHNLHVWSLSPGKDVVSVHLCVDKYCDRDLVLKNASYLIKGKTNVIDCTIQVEAYNADSVNSCPHCQLASI